MYDFMRDKLMEHFKIDSKFASELITHYKYKDQYISCQDVSKIVFNSDRESDVDVIRGFVRTMLDSNNRIYSSVQCIGPNDFSVNFRTYCMICLHYNDDLLKYYDFISDSIEKELERLMSRSVPRCY